MSNYIFTTNINKEEYDNFVCNHEYCNLLQSYDWAKIKNVWDHIYTAVYQDDKLVATGLVLVRNLPLSFTMFYIPRGPILDYRDKELLEFYFNELKKIAKDRNCLFIKFDPGILISSFHLNEERKELDFKTYLDNILNTKAIHYGYTKDISATVQPRYHMVEYKDDFSIDNLTKKGKKNLKTASKQNLDIKFGTVELLDDFTSVMKCTQERKGIALRNSEYYKLLLETYGENAFIALAYFPIKEMLEDTKNRYEICLKDLSECPTNSKKKRFTLEELKISLESKLEQYTKDIEIYGDKVCVCGTLTVKYGDTAEILYAGLNEEFKRLMGPYITWFDTMEHCFELGCNTSNMGGIEGTLKGGLVDFKEIFYPRINEYIGEFDIVMKPVMYKIVKKIMNIRKANLSKK